MVEMTSVTALDENKSPEQLYQERAKRTQDAIELRQPDRVPIQLGMSYMLAEWGGVTKQELHENPEKAQELLEKAALYFQPDNIMGVFGGPDVGRILGDKMMKWPGYGLGPNDTFQFVEGEYMKVEDYDDFLLDPADWGLRVMWPRIATRLEGLAYLPHLGTSAFGVSYSGIIPSLNHPKMVEALKALTEAAETSAKVFQRGMESSQRLGALGFPPPIFASSAFAAAPFDAMSDTLRGMRGVMLDMHKRPEKLLAAIEKMRIIITKDTINLCKATGMKFAGSMLHRGSDGFMSLPQFERFYWPSLKQMWLDLIEAGITPFVFYEGIWDQRLQYLAELPKGKTIGMFQSSDIYKVKEVLGDTMCIIGGMPNSMLQGGTVEEIRALTQRLCKEVGKGGGYIMGTQIGEMEGSKPELVKAWVEATKEFGQY
ncbi:MAG: hypothetical protein EHM21_14765 [Chloroflexi bacterium]|nr:MAG: hypothetical protein EHM21_14765 [Chloroflexota bacterium]